MSSATEKVIRDQFSYLRQALAQPIEPLNGRVLVFIGCGTSLYLSQSLAAAANLHGRAAIAVPGAEWVQRPGAYLADPAGAVVIGLSRSGTTTETVAAIKAARAQGLRTIALSCEEGSTILQAADEAHYLPTDPREGIVMTVSASLMLLAGLRLVGAEVDAPDIEAAEAALAGLDAGSALAEGRRHHVFLGAGPLNGIANEGALKLMEMSLQPAQAFHPMEFRHGPVSLIDEGALVALLYSAESATDEASLAAELQAKGAAVIGFGGPGDLSIGNPSERPSGCLRVLPALQLLGEKVALSRDINTETPRHLTKVVVLN